MYIDSSIHLFIYLFVYLHGGSVCVRGRGAGDSLLYPLCRFQRWKWDSPAWPKAPLPTLNLSMFLFVFWNSDLCSLSWPWISYAAETSFELVLLPPAPKCWDYRNETSYPAGTIVGNVSQSAVICLFGWWTFGDVKAVLWGRVRMGGWSWYSRPLMHLDFLGCC